jgi:TfoX/Sxy family transcriptional regulator of competence genes
MKYEIIIKIQRTVKGRTPLEKEYYKLDESAWQKHQQMH